MRRLMEVWYFVVIVPRIIAFQLLATSTKTRWFAVCVRYNFTYSLFRSFFSMSFLFLCFYTRPTGDWILALGKTLDSKIAPSEPDSTMHGSNCHWCVSGWMSSHCKSATGNIKVDKCTTDVSRWISFERRELIFFNKLVLIKNQGMRLHSTEAHTLMVASQHLQGCCSKLLRLHVCENHILEKVTLFAFTDNFSSSGCTVSVFWTRDNILALCVDNTCEDVPVVQTRKLIFLE